MYPCAHNTLKDILRLIGKDEFQEALRLWAESRNTTSKDCTQCHYEEFGISDNCCSCLETKLRTLSLYQHGLEPFEAELIDAARKLCDYDAPKSNIGVSARLKPFRQSLP